MRCDLIHPSELDPALTRRWRDLAVEGGYDSAFMLPGFTGAAGEARSDARVAVLEDGGRAVGFWPMHLRPLGMARPIGAPFSDQHGPVLADGVEFDPQAVLRQAGVASYSYNAMHDPRGAASAAAKELHAVYIAAPGGDGAAYLARLRAAHKRYFKSLDRRRRRAERDEAMDLRVTPDDRDPEAYETILRWKRSQYAATGKHDVLGSKWSRVMLEALKEPRRADYGLRVCTLRDGERLIAGEICLLGAGTLHSWIVAYDSGYADLTPGLQLLRGIIGSAHELGAARVNLGAGHGYYKRFFCLERGTVYEGAAFADTAAGAGRRCASALWRRVETAPLGPAAVWAGKLRRRSAQIAAAETHFAGRMRGMAHALTHLAPG